MVRGRYDYDIFILGGGTAGSHAALLLAAEGKRVGLAEPNEIGGYEATTGYGLRAPLLEAGRLFSAIRGSGEIGIRGGSVGYNFPTIRDWSMRRDVRAPHVTRENLERAGVRVYGAGARFIGPHELSVGRQHVTSAQFLVATGSVPVVPASISGLDRIGYLTPETAIGLLKPPKSVFIIGGGKTGVEFAGLFASFGSHVSVAEVSPRLLPDEDAEAGDALKRSLEAAGGDVLTSARLTSVSKDGTLHRVTYLRGDVEHIVKAEAVLLAAGREPHCDLGLENAEIDYSPLGIAVNGYLQTSAKHVYAAGSVAGTVRGAEGALTESEAAAANLLRRDKVTPAYASVPRVVYGQPIVARVGVNEADALRKDIAITTARVELAATVAGRAARDPGSVTLVADKKGVLVGATAIARDAGETINSLAVAVEAGMNVEALARLSLAYGSAGEAITAAARTLVRG